jgi:hypothetical protein
VGVVDRHSEFRRDDGFVATTRERAAKELL